MEAIAAALKAKSVGYQNVAMVVEKIYLQSSSEASSEILTPDSVVQMQNASLQTSDFGFQCVCGECTLDSYLREGCPHSAEHDKLNAAILDVSRLQSLQKGYKEHLEFQLSVESRKIMDSFGNLCLDTLKSLENQNEKASRVVTTVIFSQKFQSKQDHLTKVELELFAAKEVHEVFTLLKIHNIISFLEYRSLDRIIMDLGTKEDKDRLESYKQQLQHFCKRRVFEAPCSALTLRSKHENCSEFVVLMDKEMENTITFHDIKHTEKEIANILKLDSGTQIHLHKVCPGSVLLHFTVPLSGNRSIFPLKLSQMALLKCNGYSIIKITNHFIQVSIYEDYTRKKIMYRDFDFKEAECSRCCRILQDPQFTSCCGVNYCKQCIQFVNNDQYCSCGEKSFSFLPNRKMKGILSILYTRCIHAHLGCSWEGELSMLDEHINIKSIKEELEPSDCEFQQNCCPYQYELIHHQRQKIHTTADVYPLDSSPDSTDYEDDFEPQADPILPVTLTMTDIYQYRTEGSEEPYWVSQPFYTHYGGYKLCLSATIGEKSRLYVYITLMEGVFDGQLKWPFNANIKIQLLNHKPNCRHLERWIKYKNGERVTDGPIGAEGMGCEKPIKLYTYSSSFIRDSTLRFRVFSSLS